MAIVIQRSSDRYNLKLEGGHLKKTRLHRPWTDLGPKMSHKKAPKYYYLDWKWHLCPGLNSATKFIKLTIFRDGLAKTLKFAKLTIFRDDLAKAKKVYKFNDFSRYAYEKRRCGFYNFNGNYKIYKFHHFFVSLPRFSQPVPLR